MIGRDAFLRKIDRRIDVRQQRDQFIPDLPDLIAEPAFELFGGGTERQIGAGANQIDDSLGLRQVHFSIQKRTLSEFAGSRRSCSCTKARFQNFCGNERATVTTDLDQIFAGVSGGCAMD